MPSRFLATTGDRGLDEELDRLWRSFKALQDALSVFAPAEASPAANAPSGAVSGLVGVRETDGSPDMWVSGVEFDQSQGFVLSQSGDYAKIGGVLTTKGDLVVFGTLAARLGVGSDGQVLTADAAQALGVKWASLSTSATDVWAVKVVTANYTVLSGGDTQRLILANHPGPASITITLPSAVGQTLPIIVKNISNFNLTLNTTGGELVDGGAAGFNMISGDSLTFVSDNADWWLI